VAVLLGVTVIFKQYSVAFLTSLFYHQSKSIVTFISQTADTLLCMMCYLPNVELFLSHQLVAYEEHSRFYIMDAQLFLRLQHDLTENQDVAQPLSLSLSLNRPVPPGYTTPTSCTLNCLLMRWICEVMFTITFFSVILPQLATFAAYALHMSNQTRKLDLAVALVEAFSCAVYCVLSKQTISTALLPGLRYRFLLQNLWSMDEIPGNTTDFYVLLVKSFFYMWGNIRGFDKRSPLYVYLFIQVWDCVQKDTPTSLVYCWYKYLEPHDFRDALESKTVKCLVLDSGKVHSVPSFLCTVT